MALSVYLKTFKSRKLSWSLLYVSKSSVGNDKDKINKSSHSDETQSSRTTEKVCKYYVRRQ